jgi:DNA repair photolyase
VVKPGAAELLRRHFDRPLYRPAPITLSGNTDCYQPLERKYRITRSLLEVMLAYNHPVGLITKNSLVLRDADLLAELARRRLVHVMISVTTLREELRLLLEPRTASAGNRLRAVERLTALGVPVGVMNAPIIPGLNSQEIPQVIRRAAEAGAVTAGYTIVRLNGDIAAIFRDWLYKNLPDAAGKIWNQIAACHGGRVSDSRFGVRMRGEGKIAESIGQLFRAANNKYLAGRAMP